jgi:hypothetical protein
MNSVNKFCRQNVGSLNVKSGGTHRYTPVHTGTHRDTPVHAGTHRYTPGHTGTRRYTPVHTGTRIVTTVPEPDSKLYPHLARPVQCARRRTRQLRNHFLKKKNQSVYQNTLKLLLVSVLSGMVYGDIINELRGRLWIFPFHPASEMSARDRITLAEIARCRKV